MPLKFPKLWFLYIWKKKTADFQLFKHPKDASPPQKWNVLISMPMLFYTEKKTCCKRAIKTLQLIFWCSQMEVSSQSGAWLGVFQELAGPLVWLGIHSLKENLGILLRHLQSPYISIWFFSLCGFGSVSFSSISVSKPPSSSSQQVRKPCFSCSVFKTFWNTSYLPLRGRIKKYRAESQFISKF